MSLIQLFEFPPENFTSWRDEEQRPEFVPPLRADVNPNAERVFCVADAACKKVMRLVDEVAPTDMSVLITGETGVGKGSIARLIHEYSRREGQPFVSVNCAGLPADALEAELLGYRSNELSNQDDQYTGLLRRAEGGTLLLDGVLELESELQAKLFQLLEHGQVSPVGGDVPYSPDVRILASTHQKIREHVRHGNFRQDFFFRLNEYPIDVPPLRECSDGIEGIARFYVGRFSEEFDREIRGVSPDVIETLRSHDFPGNVSELINVVRRAVLSCEDGDVIEPPILSFDEISEPASDDDQFEEEDSHLLRFTAGEEPLTEIRKNVILETLRRFDGNRTKTAARLGVSTRTIRNRIKQYEEEDISIPE